MIDLEKKYEDSPELTALAKEILEKYPRSDLDVAKNHPWRIMFINKKTSHYGGQCRLLPGALRFQAHFEFLITIWKEGFEKSSEDEKLRLLCHEFFHIGENDEGVPRTRKHWEDFCEIPSHDQHSKKLAMLLKRPLSGLKNFPVQQELAPTVHEA